MAIRTWLLFVFLAASVLGGRAEAFDGEKQLYEAAKK